MDVEEDVADRAANLGAAGSAGLKDFLSPPLQLFVKLLDEGGFSRTFTAFESNEQSLLLHVLDFLYGHDSVFFRKVDESDSLG